MESKRAKKSGTHFSVRDSLKKATTDMLILHLLQEKPMYTYEIMQAVEERSGGAVVFTTMYQSIYRLQSFQYIREFSKVMSEDNRVRIYFTVTDEGREYLNSLILEYRSFTNGVDQILGLKREAPVKWDSSAC